MKDTTKAEEPKRRSTHIPIEEDGTDFEKLAESRLEALQAVSQELAETQKALEELKSAAEGVTLASFRSENGTTVVEIDTDPEQVMALRVYLNDSTIYYGNPEAAEETAAEPDAQPDKGVSEGTTQAEHPLNGFFAELSDMLTLSLGGPHAALDEVGRRGEIERAAYLAQVRGFRSRLTDMLDDLATYEGRLIVAEQML